MTSPDVRFQLTTDGLKSYITAVDAMLLDRCDFAQLIKVYASPREGEQRYSPADVVEALPKPIMGGPDRAEICTSHIERQNLTIRMQMRRMARLTNAFSKKWEHLWAAYCLWFANYISAGFTRRCASRMGWKLASRITSGNWRNYWHRHRHGTGGRIRRVRTFLVG